MDAGASGDAATEGARVGRVAMGPEATRTVCWVPTWNPDVPGIGLEHVELGAGHADSVLLAVDEDREPFRLTYALRWDERGLLRRADLETRKGGRSWSLHLRVDDAGRWLGAHAEHLGHLDGCVDIDIWPTPLTNSLPIWRSGLRVGERREFRMAWVSAPSLTVEAKPQAYTRLEDRLYLFESLDGSGFTAMLPVDGDGVVLDYPELFRRVALAGR